jgi:hypothetical protein
MADACARLERKVGVCEAASGGGTAYVLPGVAEANGSSVPLVCLTSDIDQKERGRGTLRELARGDRERLLRGSVLLVPPHSQSHANMEGCPHVPGPGPGPGRPDARARSRTTGSLRRLTGGVGGADGDRTRDLTLRHHRTGYDSGRLRFSRATRLIRPQISRSIPMMTTPRR